MKRDGNGLKVDLRKYGLPRVVKRFKLHEEAEALAFEAAALERLEREARERGEHLRKQGERKTYRPLPAAASTLEADIARFLPQIAGRASAGADRSHLRAWIAVAINGHRLGALPRPAITREMVTLAIAQWKTAPSDHAIRRVRVEGFEREGLTVTGYERKAPATSGHVVAVRTIKHRVRMLRELWYGLDGDDAITPADGRSVRKKIGKGPKPFPKGLPSGVIMDVAKTLAAKARPHTLVHRYRTPELLAAAEAREAARARDYLCTLARYLVLTTTGQRPCQVARTQPDDLDLAHTGLDEDLGVWVVREAKNENPHPIDLTREMILAWRFFAAADAWGDGNQALPAAERVPAYDTSKHGRRVHEAGWPKGIRPYNARHSIVLDALDRGMPLAGAQNLLGHHSPLTAQTFYGSRTLGPQRRETAKLLQGRLAEMFELREAK